MKTLNIAAILTERQFAQALDLYAAHFGTKNLHLLLREQVIQPNIDEIRRKAGEASDPDFLAYGLESVISADPRWWRR